jgi:hypothetical protein
MEQIRDRYQVGRANISPQITALQNEETFRNACSVYYAHGAKDWMLISAVYNVILNVFLRDERVNLLDPVASRKAVEKFRSQPISTIYPVSLFLGTNFDMCMHSFHSTCIVTWGFHQRVSRFKAGTHERFLRERMRHFDLDIPHNPMFGDPPGGCPVID